MNCSRMRLKQMWGFPAFLCCLSFGVLDRQNKQSEDIDLGSENLFTSLLTFYRSADNEMLISGCPSKCFYSTKKWRKRAQPSKDPVSGKHMFLRHSHSISNAELNTRLEVPRHLTLFERKIAAGFKAVLKDALEKGRCSRSAEGNITLLN